MEHNPTTHTQPLKLTTHKLGGLKHLERLLGTRQDGVLTIDDMLISLDLEVASDRERLYLSAEKPVVRQLAFTSLNTQDIRSLSASSDLNNLISLQMFEVRLKRMSKKARECIFAETQFITFEKVSAVIKQKLCIMDSRADNNSLRNIVLVGYSLGEDLRILRFLSIDIANVRPILTAIDTHLISRFLFPAHHPHRAPEPGQNFSLAVVLAELGSSPHWSRFHNAGNDAIYTLYPMLLLAIKAGTARRQKLSTGESVNLETIRGSSV
jgi:hypothetical protein